MIIKDYFKASLLNLFRDKKKISYILVTLICVLLCIALLVFSRNVEKLLNVTISKDVGFRTLTTMPRIENVEAEEQKYDLEKDIDDLLNIKYVVDVFSNNYRGVVLYDTNLKNENLDGTVTLLRGTSNTLPLIVAGRGFEGGEKGVAICPQKFYPNLDPLIINKKHLIDGNKLLNTAFTVEYHNYILDKFDKSTVNETFTKSFKIIGLYDTGQVMNDNGTCYIPAEDVMEIEDTERTIISETNESYALSLSGINIVIDNLKNVEYVTKEIEELGFKFTALDSEVDVGFVNIIRMSIAAMLSVVLFTIVILTSSYTKKKINREEKTIGILRTCGYSKTTVKWQYVLELLITNLFIFIIGITMFLIIYFIALQNVNFLVGINLMMGGIRVGIFPLVLSFLITVGLPCLIVSFYISKKCKLDIVKLIGDEE